MGKELEHAGYSVRGIANWVLDYSESYGYSQTNMALNKLVFFVIEAVLLNSGKLLTNAKIEAWDHGPVFREVYHDFKGFGDRPIEGRASFFSTRSGQLERAQVALCPEDESEIASVLRPLIPMSASQLRALSHVENGAWDRVWSYDGFANPGMEITPEIMLAAAARRGDADEDG
ncbi:MAG: DUF4065 domain-containing protein [Sphingomonadaceae bacterium]|nr:DUF4065 domain-containing protein [Sphingomonadaceae bacterium]